MNKLLIYWSIFLLFPKLLIGQETKRCLTSFGVESKNGQILYPGLNKIKFIGILGNADSISIEIQGIATLNIDSCFNGIIMIPTQFKVNPECPNDSCLVKLIFRSKSQKILFEKVFFISEIPPPNISIPIISNHNIVEMYKFRKIKRIDFGDCSSKIMMADYSMIETFKVMIVSENGKKNTATNKGQYFSSTTIELIESVKPNDIVMFYDIQIVSRVSPFKFQAADFLYFVK